MNSRPDLILLLLVVFSLGVAVTLLLPANASQSEAEPNAALSAGVFTQPEPSGSPRLVESE